MFINKSEKCNGKYHLMEIYSLATISFVATLFFSSLLFAEFPDKMLLKQKFEEGDHFQYKLKEKHEIINNDEEMDFSPKEFEYQLRVSSVSSEGKMEIVISKRVFTSAALSIPYSKAANAKEQVRIELRLDGETKIISRSAPEIRWRDFILNLPPKELKIGEIYVSSGPIPEGFPFSGQYKREITLVGFEKVGQLRCAKVNIIRENVSTDKEGTSMHYQSKKVLYLAYKLGFFVVKSNEQISMECTDKKQEKSFDLKEITIELAQDEKDSDLSQPEKILPTKSVIGNKEREVPVVR